MSAGFIIEQGDYGPRAVLTGGWSDAIEGQLLQLNVAEIELNDGKGWRGESVGFLVNFPHLRALKILNLRLPRVDEINELHQLRSLDVITYCKTELQFSNFPHLEDCALNWRSKAASLFDCRTLKNLFVDRYSGKDVVPFGRLGELTSLAILNAPVASLNGISGLKKLLKFRIGNLRCLQSLSGLENLVSLTELEVHTCRAISDIEEIGSLTNLKILLLNNDGEIASLKPLNKLSQLESVIFCESTDIKDGDLSPLLRQTKLKRVAFKKRRHYSLLREELSLAHST